MRLRKPTIGFLQTGAPEMPLALTHSRTLARNRILSLKQKSWEWGRGMDRCCIWSLGAWSSDDLGAGLRLLLSLIYSGPSWLDGVHLLGESPHTDSLTGTPKVLFLALLNPVTLTPEVNYQISLFPAITILPLDHLLDTVFCVVLFNTLIAHLFSWRHFFKPVCVCVCVFSSMLRCFQRQSAYLAYFRD